MRVKCPFLFLMNNGDMLDGSYCVYADKSNCCEHTEGGDININQRNDDAWCYKMIELAVDIKSKVGK